MAESPIIEVQNITKRFKGLTAVKDVSFSIREGGITGMIGPNGAGKSTTFNMICGYYPPTEGRIFYKGEDIMERIQKRKNAVAFADAINSIEGVPPSPIARRLSDQWKQEKISSTEMVRALVEHYSALGRK